MIQTASDYRLPKNLEGTVLDKIVSTKIREIEAAIKVFPAESIEGALERAPEVRSLKRAIVSGDVPAIIAEIKRASPSAGLLREDFDPEGIARQYRQSGAAALSVVTEVHHFRGNLEILAALRWHTDLPLLRKDFIIDPYQLIEARRVGADAVLLIAALMDAADLRLMILEAERLGMDALVEVHDQDELRKALDAGAGLVGVNNRDLRTLEVSLDVSLDLAPIIPAKVVAVAESGIRTADDIRRLADAGYQGFLVGEHLMRAASPGAALRELRSGAVHSGRRHS
ncbi:MAG: indole-3-glycerol phosphate synthase TrpC [Acidobacteria bacterium]|nr:indole-3-glycerol phosphate synthase TrpC [Acidobacteriota bacterium]